MNPHDRANLNFLMNSSPETIRDWYNRITEDEVQYALELIQMARLEMSMEEFDITEMEVSDRFANCLDAKAALSKFTLKGIK